MAAYILSRAVPGTKRRTGETSAPDQGTITLEMSIRGCKAVFFRRPANGTALLLALLLVAAVPAARGQSAVGHWRTIDDATGEPKAIVEIYEDEDGKLYGRVVDILQASEEAVRNDEGQIICTACEGARHDRPVVGMVIIEHMEKDGDEWEDGTILDPENGKTYKAKMELDGPNTLKVRGYIGIPLLGRTQTWYRVPQDTSGT